MSEFFNSISIVPTQEMSLTEQTYAVIRLILFFFVIMLLFDFKFSVHFLCISLIIVITLYYIKKNKMKNCQENYTKPTKRGEIRENYAPAWKSMKPTGVKIDYNFVPVASMGQQVRVGGSMVSPSPNVSAGFASPAAYSNMATSSKKLMNGQWVSETSIVTPETIPFCNDEVNIDSPTSVAVSLNQSLANGGRTPHNMIGNPVTRIKPVIVPPSLDIGYWRENNLIEHSQINKKPAQEELYLSGYAESSCCGYLGNGAELVPRKPRENPAHIGGTSGWNSVEGFNVRGAPVDPMMRRGIKAPVPVQDLPYVPVAQVQNPTMATVGNPELQRPFMREGPALRERTRENFNVRGAQSQPNNGRGIRAPVPVQDLPYVPVAQVQNPTIQENYNYETEPDGLWPRASQKGGPIPAQNIEVLSDDYYLPGAVNKTCGYNPEQIFTAGLPSNYASGTCEQDPSMKQYNENLFTSIVTPGVYQRSQITENPMSNLGISFTQQFPPMSCKRDDKGLMYTLSDPNIIEPVEHIETPLEEAYEETPRYDTVFDPRFNGYGTSYRSYIDPMLGQPKFFYDDVNAIRNPNFVIRSKIDHLPYADSYGPITEKNLDGTNTPYMRALVQDSWLRDSLQFRDELTQSRMRKINAESWQKRQAPFAAQSVGSTKKR